MRAFVCVFPLLCTIYSMSGRVVSDIQTRAVYNTDANVVNDLKKNDSSYEFIGEVILKINVV